MKKDLTQVKSRLIELGYLDNEWLDKYLELIEANLDTHKVKKSTQAHHVIPVNTYWNPTIPYQRKESIKLAQADPINFEVNLLYKDHLLAHSYLTLFTNLDAVQARYESQADLRKRNSRIAIATSITKGTNAVTNSRKAIKTKYDDQKTLTNLKQFYSDDEIDDILNL